MVYKTSVNLFLQNKSETFLATRRCITLTYHLHYIKTEFYRKKGLNKRTSGGGRRSPPPPPPPSGFFSDVFKTFYFLLMPSSVAVRLSLRHILVKFSDNRLRNIFKLIVVHIR